MGRRSTPITYSQALVARNWEVKFYGGFLSFKEYELHIIHIIEKMDSEYGIQVIRLSRVFDVSLIK